MSRAKKILQLATTLVEKNDEFAALSQTTSNVPIPLLDTYERNNNNFCLSQEYNTNSENENFVILQREHDSNIVLEYADLNNVSVVENVIMEISSDVLEDLELNHDQGNAHNISSTSENLGSQVDTNIHDQDVITSSSMQISIPESVDFISDESNVSLKLVPYSDHSDSDMSLEEYPKKCKTRKKRFQVNKQTWFSEKNRNLREHGRRYLGRGKKEDKWVYDIKKQPRLMKRRCSCKETKTGHLKCSSICETDRKKIFDYFWSLNWGEKKTLINSTVSIIPINRPRNRKEPDASRRSQSIIYHLRLNDSNIRVCRVMFLNTLCIGRMTVLEWKRKLGPGKENIKKSRKERAMKITNADKVKPFDKENKELMNFIESLPILESHYCRSSSQKKYLLPEWQSKKSLYRFYVSDWCEQKNISPLSITTFSQTLAMHNIALFHPKKDQCEKCSAYKLGHVSEDEYNLHLTKKEEARKEKEKDKANNESLVFTMDLQAVLMAPKSKISNLYYKTKLCVHNLCFYNLGNKDGFCYIWNETEGGLNAEEFATICARFITEKVLPTIDRENCEKPIKIILYSDGCPYQNCNVTVSNALLNVALNEQITIEQKYLEVGHTQMEADSMHSTIERYLKDKIINVPAEYYGVCRGARRKPNKYDVTYLNHTFFKNFKKVEFLKSIRPGKKKGDSKVLDIRAIKYDAYGQVYYKLRFTDGWEILPQRRTCGVTPCSLHALDQLHTQRLKIKSKKFADLQSLKFTLADDYHDFYDGLPHE